MELLIVSVFTITLCLAQIIEADLSDDRVSDAWADFYKSYYEQHNEAQERDHGYHAPAPISSGYDTPSVAYDSPTYGAYSASPALDLLSPETSVG